MENSKKLLEKYLAGTCTEEERALVEAWYLKATNEAADFDGKENLAEVEKQIWAKVAPKQSYLLRYRKTLTVAATLLLVGVLSLLTYRFQNDTKSDLSVNTPKNAEIVAGGKKAILTLSNGKQVVLDSILHNETAAFNVSDFISGINSDIASQVEQQAVIHRIDIPKGGEFHFVLNDGTKVWLNSESSFSFPSKFNGTERKVDLVGEGYFEVAKDRTKPFRVLANGTEIKVLGTHFNVSSYKEEEKTVVTLAEGSVMVANQQSSVMLKPNQAAEVSPSAHTMKVANVHVAEVLAWKDGYFVFDNSNIRTIMKTLSRWYDVEIVYKGEVTTKKFGGTFSRSKNLKDLLAAIESFGAVHFKVEGRRVTVLP